MKFIHEIVNVKWNKIFNKIVSFIIYIYINIKKYYNLYHISYHKRYTTKTRRENKNVLCVCFFLLFLLKLDNKREEMRRNRIKLFLAISSLNMVLILMIVYHERIITAFDIIGMPTSDYPCDKLPFNISIMK